MSIDGFPVAQIVASMAASGSIRFPAPPPPPDPKERALAQAARDVRRRKTIRESTQAWREKRRRLREESWLLLMRN